MNEHKVVAGLMNNPAYSHTVVAAGGRTVYISGQVAIDETGALVGGDDLGAQTAQVMRNLGLALAAGGGGDWADGLGTADLMDGIIIVGASSTTS